VRGLGKSKKKLGSSGRTRTILPIQPLARIHNDFAINTEKQSAGKNQVLWTEIGWNRGNRGNGWIGGTKAVQTWSSCAVNAPVSSNDSRSIRTSAVTPKRKVETYRKHASRMTPSGAVRNDRERLSNPYQTRDLCPVTPAQPTQSVIPV